MSKKNYKSIAVRLLEEKGINIIQHEYPHGKEVVDGLTVARLIGMPAGKVYKTLVTKGIDDLPRVFVIPVDSHLSLKKAAKAAKIKHLEMLNSRDIVGITGYVRGGCSPVGMKKKYETFIHEAALKEDTIIVSAGKIGYQIEIAPKDLARAVEAEFFDLVDKL